MLDIMRKSASSWWLKALLLAVALSFIIGFGILSTVSDDDQSRYAARVGKTIITHAEFQKAFEVEIQALKKKLGEELKDEDIEKLGIRESVMENEINRVLELEEAKRLNIPVTNEEVRDVIKSIPYFKKEGEFNYEMYTEVLDYNRITEAGFEAMIRNDIIIQKLESIVKDSVKVMDEDIIAMAEYQGITKEEYNELAPELKELLERNTLMVKRISTYKNFLKDLQAKTEIDINKEYID